MTVFYSILHVAAIMSMNNELLLLNIYVISCIHVDASECVYACQGGRGIKQNKRKIFKMCDKNLYDFAVFTSAE